MSGALLLVPVAGSVPAAVVVGATVVVGASVGGGATVVAAVVVVGSRGGTGGRATRDGGRRGLTDRDSCRGLLGQRTCGAGRRR